MRLSNHQNGGKPSRQYQQIDEFQRLLAASGLSKASLGRKLAVHPNTISRWGSGQVEVPGPALAYLRLYVAVRAGLGD